MKNKDLNKLLFLCLCLSSVLFILSFFFSNDSFSRQKSVDSSLLNPKYKNDVGLIVIQDKETGDEISIEKKDGIFLVKKDGKNDFADQKIAELLVNNFIKIRKIYKINSNISKNVKKNRQYKTGEHNGSLKNNTISGLLNKKTGVFFYSSNGSILSQIDFTSENQLLNRISFFSSGSCYETEDDFSQFLTQNFNYWTDGKLFPEIKTPVKIMYSSYQSKGLGSFGAFSLSNTENGFQSAEAALLALRHGSASDASFDFSSPYSSLRIEDGSGLVSVMSFQETDDENFICARKIFSSEPALQSLNPLSSINAVYEISGWTLKKIESVFKN